MQSYEIQKSYSNPRTSFVVPREPPPPLSGGGMGGGVQLSACSCLFALEATRGPHRGGAPVGEPYRAGHNRSAIPRGFLGIPMIY